MVHGYQEKRDLERTAVKIFIQIYNQNHDKKLRLLYQRERPDAVLQDSYHRKMGVEITHLFYDSEEAKMLLGRSKERVHSLEVIEMLIEELNKRIQTKEIKIDKYSTTYPIALIIRNASRAFGMSDILRAKELIYKPQGKFTHIWFISRDGTDEWLMKDLHEL
ncbi:hypothetical protein GC093_00260 [Paenibacillus sp. LMG 31456]|uniref:Uncharacterized protein n=1 Tax=Paenibacillus foliorum TaxID=2654974 RepID=A0A972K0G7_9BACL|nr:hypothetical protein [Paenibacillus foliorum]NOU91672.1 hypothetical protein [Paenibacillus foliorum]